MKLRLYLKEILYLKYYIIAVTAILLVSYSVYFFLDEKLVARLGSEDNFFEWITALSFLVASLFFWKAFRANKNLIFLILAFVFFLGFGEEISWGQRILGFNTPGTIDKLNVQHEFNLHNLEFFNTKYTNGDSKHGFKRLLEVNFMFKLLTIIAGIVFPIAAFHLGFVKKMAGKIKIPVPPVSIGIFFIINWLVFKFLLSYILPSGYEFQYYDSDTEIFEFVASAIVLVIAIFFYNNTSREYSLDIKYQLPGEGQEVKPQFRQTLWGAIVRFGVRLTEGRK